MSLKTPLPCQRETKLGILIVGINAETSMGYHAPKGRGKTDEIVTPHEFTNRGFDKRGGRERKENLKRHNRDHEPQLGISFFCTEMSQKKNRFRTYSWTYFIFYSDRTEYTWKGNSSKHPGSDKQKLPLVLLSRYQHMSRSDWSLVWPGFPLSVRESQKKNRWSCKICL